MPPPVSPAFTTTGIPVDSPFNLASGQQHSEPAANGMVMPEAVPSEPRRGVGRRGKHDFGNPLSQGYAIKLETVPEQSGSLEDHFSEPYSTRYSTTHQGNSNSSDELQFESTNLLVFPSADASSDLHLQRKKGKRRKSGTRRAEHAVDTHPMRDYGATGATIYHNRAPIENGFGEHDDSFDAPIKLSRRDRYKPSSPRQEGKYLRQKAREKELAKQKELLRRKTEEEDRKRRIAQEKRAAKIAWDFSASRNRNTHRDVPRYDSDHGRSNSLVLQQAAIFDAQAQLLAEDLASKTPGSQSPMIHKALQSQSSHERRPSREDREISLRMFDQITTL